MLKYVIIEQEEYRMFTIAIMCTLVAIAWIAIDESNRQEILIEILIEILREGLTTIPHLDTYLYRALILYQKMAEKSISALPQRVLNNCYVICGFRSCVRIIANN